MLCTFTYEDLDGNKSTEDFDVYIKLDSIPADFGANLVETMQWIDNNKNRIKYGREITFESRGYWSSFRENDDPKILSCTLLLCPHPELLVEFVDSLWTPSQPVKDYIKTQFLSQMIDFRPHNLSTLQQIAINELIDRANSFLQEYRDNLNEVEKKLCSIQNI